MATETTTQAYEPTAQYTVKLTKPVNVFGAQLLPLHEHEIRGDVLNSIMEKEGVDAVGTAVAIS
jgi:hypothetical protein